MAIIHPVPTPVYSHIVPAGNYSGSNSSGGIYWVDPGCTVVVKHDHNGNEFVQQECGVVSKVVDTTLGAVS